MSIAFWFVIHIFDILFALIAIDLLLAIFIFRKDIKKLLMNLKKNNKINK